MEDKESDKSPILHSTYGDFHSNEDDDVLYYDSFPRIGNPSPVSPYANDYGDVITDKSPNDVSKTHIKVYKRRWYIMIMFSLFSNAQNGVYKRRWYIMIMFSLFSNAQNGVWNTWGPISNSSERVFGWHDSTIAWLNNWGPISFIMSGIFFPWLLQVKGLRAAILSSTILVSIGCSLRVITSEPSTATILIHIGQYFNGLAGPMAMGAVPHLSATWFPVNERVTATAISTSIGMFGTAISFVLGPALVSDATGGNNSTNSSLGFLAADDLASSSNVTNDIIDNERREIMYYMYYTCGWSWLITIIIAIYFPSKPPLPPCVSAVVERDKFWAGMWSLRKKGSFLVIAFIYGVSVGVVNVWVSVLNVNLRTLHVTELTSGWIGFYATISMCAMSLLVGRFANYFARMMKLFILVLYVLGTVLFVVFCLMLNGTIPYSTALLYGSVIGALTLINAAVPLMYELSCEMAFPTSEGSANGVLTYLNNCSGLVFLAIFSIPHIGTMWMNWTAVGATAVCIPLIGLLKGRMKRLEVDEGTQP